MEGAERTTRQRIAHFLRHDSAEPSTLAAEFEITTPAALSHVEHIAESLERTEEELLVAPPECQDCGFSEFDNLINRPSRCPECKSENVSDPLFTIE
jgi:predicted Zn-ribbon and HTH transcriptional regulator